MHPSLRFSSRSLDAGEGGAERVRRLLLLPLRDYDTDASTFYGISPFFVLLLQPAIVIAAARCLCFGPALSSRSCAVAAFVLSWCVP